MKFLDGILHVIAYLLGVGLGLIELLIGLCLRWWLVLPCVGAYFLVQWLCSR